MKKVDRFLNSDVLIEILTRVPAKELLLLKLVCKEWQRVISSRSFMKAQLGRTTEVALTGFIFQEKFKWCNEDIKTVSYIPARGGSNSKVNHVVFDFLPEDVVMLASCKGLVCCRSCFPSEQPVIYVCNPSNREWIKLEWPWPISHYDRNNRSMALALAFDIDPSKGFVAKFKLVRVKQVEEGEGEGERYFTFELYSSEKRAWRKSGEICQCYNKLVKNEGIYIGGVLHWLTDGDRVLTFDVEKELAGQFWCRFQGVHVWCLEDYYEFKWTIVHSKSLEEIEGEWPHFFMNLKNHVLERMNGPWVNPLAFKDGLLLMKVCVNLYLYDVKNNKMTQACSTQDLKSQCMFNPTVLPHSLSLIPLSPA
ncbi:F-box protein [Spatholobus suberectus]|nr:F-box protein [Spatholobus suberectus]